MEGSPEHLDVEVDGVAALISFGPAPITFFYDETGEVGHQKVASSGLDEEVSTFFQQRGEIGFSGLADLLTSPRWDRFLCVRGVGHSLSSSGVG